MAAVLFTVLVAAVAQWRMLLEGLVPWSQDTLNYFYPLNALTGKLLRAGQLPVWSAHQMGGMPLMGDPQAGWGNLASMLAYTLLPRDPATVAVITAQVALAGVGMLLFLRSTGVGVSGSTLGGLAYGLSGSLITPHIDVAYGNLAYVGMLVSLPWLLLGADIAVRRRGWKRLAGWSLTAFVASQALGSWLGQGAYYVFFATAAYVLFLVLLGPPASGRRLLGRVRELVIHSVALGVLVVGWSAWSLLPRLELLAVSNLSGGYGAGEQQFSGGSRLDVWQIYLTSGKGYVGAATVLLILAALLLRPGRTQVFYAAMSAGLYAVSLRWIVELVTEHAQARSLLGLIPGALQLHLHYPQRIAPLYLFFACALAGATLEKLLSARPRLGLRGRGSLAAMVALLGLGGVLAVALGRLNPAYAPFYAGLLLSAGLVIAVWSGRLATGAGGALLVLLTAVELVASQFASDRALAAPGPYYNSPEILASVALVRSAPGGGRYFGYDPAVIERYGGLRNGYRRFWLDPQVQGLLVTTQATVHGLEDVQGYNPLHLQSYDRLLEVANGLEQNYRSAYVQKRALRSPLLDMLNARHVLVPRGTSLPEKYRLVRSVGEVSLYENTHALPRAWTVHRVSVAGDDAALRRIDRGEVDPRIRSIVPSPLTGLEPARGADDVAVTSYRQDEITVRARMTSPGLLVMSELDYPAWKVRVDGESRPVVRANGALRAVQVPGGEHTVTWYYSSSYTRFGLAVTALTLLATAAALAILLRRSGRSPGPKADSQPQG
jgi:hypothetical protein